MDWDRAPGRGALQTAGNPSRGPGPRPSSDRPVLSSARPEGRNTRPLGRQALVPACQPVSKSPFRPPGGGGSSVSGMGLTQSIKKVCLPACWSRAGPPCVSMLSHSHQNSSDGRRVRGQPREAAVRSSPAGPGARSVASMGHEGHLAGGAGKGVLQLPRRLPAPPPPPALHCGLGA